MGELLLSIIILTWLFVSEKLNCKFRNTITIIVDILAVLCFLVLDLLMIQRIALIMGLVILGCIWLINDNRGRGLNAKIGIEEIKKSGIADFFFCAGVVLLYIVLKLQI